MAANVGTTGTWWRHQMEAFSALLALCAGNSPVTGEFPSQRSVTRSFNVFFVLRLNRRLSKHSRRRWCEIPSRSLWRHCNVIYLYNDASQVNQIWFIRLAMYWMIRSQQQPQRNSLCETWLRPCLLILNHITTLEKHWQCFDVIIEVHVWTHNLNFTPKRIKMRFSWPFRTHLPPLCRRHASMHWVNIGSGNGLWPAHQQRCAKPLLCVWYGQSIISVQNCGMYGRNLLVNGASDERLYAPIIYLSTKS